MSAIGAIEKRKVRTLAQAVGAVLTKLRVQNHLSLDEVSRRAGYSAHHMRNVERARKCPTLRTLNNLAKVHRVKLSAILRAAEKRQGTPSRRKKESGIRDHR